MTKSRGRAKVIRRFVGLVGTSCVLAIALVLVIPLVGGTIDLGEALRTPPWSTGDSPSAVIFWQTRVPRVLTALGCGSALAMAGVVFQAILRNPLAEPYILGVSGGAALGKTLVVVLGSTVGGRFLFLSDAGAFLGALVPLLVLHGIGRRRQLWTSETLLLAGVVMNVICSALLLLIQYFSDFTMVRQMLAWMLGGVDSVDYGRVALLLTVSLGGAMVLVGLSRALNVLTLGPSMAGHLGVNVGRVVTLVLWIGVLLTAVSVAVAGPIGFVGLVVPHIVRSLFGSDHRFLVPLAGIFGGIFLMLCDLVGWRGMEMLAALGVPLDQIAEIPVGIITACVGGPFFLVVLLRRQRPFDG